MVLSSVGIYPGKGHGWYSAVTFRSMKYFLKRVCRPIRSGKTYIIIQIVHITQVKRGSNSYLFCYNMYHCYVSNVTIR